LNTAKVLVGCLLVTTLIAPGCRSAGSAGTESPEAPKLALRAQLLAVLREGVENTRAGRYVEATRYFSFLQQLSSTLQIKDLNARALGNIGACQFALHQYRPALKSFLEARSLAVRAKDSSAAAAFDANIASLYSELGELDSAAAWMKGTMDRLSAPDRADHLPKFLIQLATLRARQNQMDEAARLFQQGIEAADQSRDLDLYANGWNRMGEELLKRGRLVEAEPALLEAYRVRKLNRLTLES
jgi:tetratricopeptide (TPR) repeat protein